MPVVGTGNTFFIFSLRDMLGGSVNSHRMVTLRIDTICSFAIQSDFSLNMLRFCECIESWL